ncbi:hypothetical protein [Chakrabartyella piscis]|uniref:hypothetical protein n=1 Tax=Chakrabartyella piscis TaxID=2918914 RepID=UPI0029585A7A|nr:hypothetical protein [Chakrabartyella piscis]
MTNHEIMKHFSFSQAVLNLNYRDLEQFHKKFDDPVFCLHITSKNDGINFFHWNSLRYVMNYMSAWYAIKSLLQAQMKPNHLGVTDEFRTDYQKKIQSVYVSNELCRFFEDCRNVFIHEGIPFASMNLSFGQEVSLKLLVDVNQLKQSTYFKKGTKYVEGLESVDFYEICKEHYSINKEFYKWFNDNIKWEHLKPRETTAK